MKIDDGLELFVGTFLWAFIGLGVAGILYGLGAADDTENLVKFFFFQIMGSLFIVTNLVTVFLQNKGFFEKYPELKGFQYLTFHSPDQTPLGQKFPGFVNAKVLTAFFLAFASFFGALVAVNSQIAVGTPELVAGSVSPATSLALAVEPAVINETLAFQGVMLFGFIGLFYFVFKRNGVSHRASYAISHVLSVILSSVGFLFYHSFRYGATETAQSSILMQGFIYNSVTAVTHSLIPAYLIHASGNFFSKASKEGIFTSETAILLAVVGVVFPGIASVYFLFNHLGE